jgi:hypothetical protein
MNKHSVWIVWMGDILSRNGRGYRENRYSKISKASQMRWQKIIQYSRPMDKSRFTGKVFSWHWETEK